MSKTSRTALLSALMTTTALAASPVASAATTVWANTATQGIAVSQLVKAVDTGAVTPSQALIVRMGLNIQNKAALLAFVKAANSRTSPTYGTYLSPAQFKTYYGPTSAQVATVTAYLKSFGFTNIVVEPNNLIVSANGTASMAEAAFNTKLENVTMAAAGVTGFINTTAAQVPASMSGLVAGVLGLNTIGKMTPPLLKTVGKVGTKPAAVTVPNVIGEYTPVQFRDIYSEDDVKFACCTKIAIMAEGNMTQVVKDLRTAETAFGEVMVPLAVETVGLASPDVSGVDEWDLDSQTSSGVAGQVSELYLYTTTSLSDSDLALEFSRWATDKKTRAASASLGECEEFPYLDGSMVIDDMTFLQAAAQGMTFFASAGDTGAFCPLPVVGVNGVPAGAPLVNYPASSTYAIGVGGTTLLTTGTDTYDTEISWYSGGGGMSLFEAPPYWQSAAVSLIATTAMRGVPDIAMDADPNTGEEVYVDGAPEEVGGTSLSSPLALGSWARIINTDWSLGAAGPALYSLYDDAGLTPTYPKGGFHDIIVGTNVGYEALPGYDYTTGLGTLIVDQLTAALK